MKFIESSAGTIVVNESGVPISDLPHEYNDISCFDLTRLRRMCLTLGIECRDSWDILAVGYWLDNGDYEEPASMYTEHGCMKYVWTGEADDVYEAIELEQERNPYARSF